MFFRKTTSRNKGKEYTYLKLIENYREGNKVKQRVIANLGNLESLTPEKVQALISGLSRICGVSHNSTQLEAKKVLRYGEVLALHNIWEMISATKAFEKSINDQYNLNIPLLSELMALDQVIKPPDKQAINDWYQHLSPPALEKTDLRPHHFYSALNVLAEYKYQIEGSIFKQLTRLFPIDTDFAFCRLATCTYEPSSRSELHSSIYGKYILEEPDEFKNIDFGLMSSNDGVPFGHWIFQSDSGEIDFKEILSYLNNNYGFKKCIFVGERNVTANAKMELLVAHGYEYLAGRKLWHYQDRDLLYREQLHGKKDFTELNEGLWFKEITGYDVRQVLCCDLLRANYKIDLLEEHLKAVEDDLNAIKKAIDASHNTLYNTGFNKNAPVFKNIYCRKYFEWHYDEGARQFNYRRKDDIIALEQKQAGTFLLETNSNQLSGRELVQSYTSMRQLGEPYRINNNFTASPSQLYVDTNISANIFICLLAAILVKTMERLLRKAGINLHPRQALELLEDIKLSINQLDDREVSSVTKIPKIQEEILKAIGVDDQQRTII